MEQCSFCGKTIDGVRRLVRIPIRKTNMENIATCVMTRDTITTKVPMLLESQQTSELCLNNA